MFVENKSLQTQLQRTRHQTEQVRQLLDQERIENQRLREQLIKLPCDLPVKGHSYGPKMISFCLQLVQRVGFRASEAVLRIVFNFFKITDKIPSHDAMRSWSSRVGIALLEQDHTLESQPDDDWIWMSDHSNQVGQEKLLVIMGIRVCDHGDSLGQTLSREKLKVLTVVPGKEWKRDDVRREYQRLAERMGPR